MTMRPKCLQVLINLWGKTTVAFYKTDELGKPIALNELLTMETEDNCIIGIKGYYFCPELLEAASKILGVHRE